MRGLIAYFKEAPVAARNHDARVVAEQFALWRNHVLYGSLVGYGLFYFCRKNISIALPLLSKDLGYTNAELGILGSVLYVTYGVSKFLSGVVADRAAPRAFMTTGLVLSALSCIAFGLSSSLWVFVALWSVNGIFQSTGAPASAKILATWFSAKERGTKTGIWNISHQGGGGLVLVVAGLFATYFGWRGAFIGPGIIALVGGLLVARYLRDRPEAYGLPSVEEHQKEAVVTSPDDALPMFQLVVKNVLTNKRVWIIALASCFTYVVRYGALDWAPKYLYEVRGMSIASTGWNASLLEIIGIPGALLCGYLSDRVFGARRAPVAFGSLMLLAMSVWMLLSIPQGYAWLDSLALALIGFFTYGPQMLLAGVAPVDISGKRVAAAAVGFTGLMSYAGATLSSTVTGYLLDKSGWGAAFAFWIAAALVAALLCIPLWGQSGSTEAKPLRPVAT